MKQKQTLGLNLHDFRFNRDTRRMVCHKCDGVMGEYPHTCNPKRVYVGGFSSGIIPERTPFDDVMSRAVTELRVNPDPFDEMESANG